MRFNTSIILGTCLSILIYVILGLLVFSGNTAAENSSFLGNITKQFIIVLGIFLGGMILAFALKGSDDDENESINKYDVNDELYDISHDVLFTSPPLDVRLGKALQKIQKIMGYEAISVGIYDEINELQVIGQRSNSKSFLLDKKIIPEQKEYPLTSFSSLEDLIYSFYKSNSVPMTKTIKLNQKISFESFIMPLKTSTSLKPFGYFCIVLHKGDNFSKDMQEKLLFIANSISFAVNLDYKKDALMQANLRFYKQHNEIDESLNIYNKTKLEKTTNSEAERYKRYLTPLSLVMFSIDELENISNIMTHQEVLALRCDFANLIKEHIRSTDVFGLWENDVFAIIATNVDYQGTHVLVNKLMAIIKKHSFYRISNLTCSFGITSFSTKDTPSLFYSRALDALNKAKLKGGNNFEIQLLV